MAKHQYRVTGRSKWSSTAGNALLVIANKLGSGKRIEIQSVELSNINAVGSPRLTTDGTNFTSGLVHAIRNSMYLIRTSALNGGEDLSNRVGKYDSAFPSISPVSISTMTPYFSNSILATYLEGPSTYTDATVAIGDVTFTPGTAPSWVVNGHRDSDRYFLVSSGFNVGLYKIIGNTATALTLDPPLYEVGSTTGSIVSFSDFISKVKVGKNYTTASGASQFFLSNFGSPRKGQPIGSLYTANRQNTVAGQVQAVTLAENQSISLIAPSPTLTTPGYVNVEFSITSGANVYTYSIEEYVGVIGWNESLITITNPSGSGVTVQIRNVSFTEIGSFDTPYFQLVPIQSVDAGTYTDTDKHISVIKYDTNSPDLTSSIASVFSNAYLLPYGVPASYLSEGSAGSPKGFNYLNTKDFIGPVFGTVFPENVAAKLCGVAGDNGSSTFGTHLSQKMSVMRGRSPLTFMEGEGFAIVAGAETAAGTTNISVSNSAWAMYEFGITFTVDNATIPYLTLTGLPVNTEVRILESGTQNEYAGSENVVSGTFSWAYEYTPGMAVDIAILNMDYQFQRLNNISLTSTGISIPIQLIPDRNYINP